MAILLHWELLKYLISDDDDLNQSQTKTIDTILIESYGLVGRFFLLTKMEMKGKSEHDFLGVVHDHDENHKIILIY